MSKGRGLLWVTEISCLYFKTLTEIPAKNLLLGKVQSIFRKYSIAIGCLQPLKVAKCWQSIKTGLEFNTQNYARPILNDASESRHVLQYVFDVKLLGNEEFKSLNALHSFLNVLWIGLFLNLGNLKIVNFNSHNSPASMLAELKFTYLKAAKVGALSGGLQCSSPFHQLVGSMSIFLIASFSGV